MASLADSKLVLQLNFVKIGKNWCWMFGIATVTRPTFWKQKFLEGTEKYKNVLGKLDVVYSTFKGVDGLLPMEAEVHQLAKVVLDAQTLWLNCSFNINENLKCHLIFYGHLVHQFWKYGGLPNKNEDVIEFNHQTWKGEKEPTRMVKNFCTQQRCQVQKM
jgi:hypothetical protein